MSILSEATLPITKDLTCGSCSGEKLIMSETRRKGQIRVTIGAVRNSLARKAQ